MSNFSERLNELMFEHKKSAQMLANEIGVAKQTIYRYLSNERTPTLENLISLADFFNCSIDYLVGRIETDDSMTFKQCPAFYERLPYVLDHYKYTKYRLAKESGIDESVISWWAKGEREPTLDSIIRIANTLDCTIDYLLGRE